jgi:hypothetical protein
MELFGVALSVPVAFVSSALYCFLLIRVVCNHERLSRRLRLVSGVVLAMFAVEIALLIALGSVRSRGLLGPSFYVAHVVVFFLGPPALANLLILSRRGPLVKWYVASALCTVFAFFLVLLQYTVAESLLGIE